ncbi:MAG: hypothetical protein HOO95_03495 [Gallionella sp.]|nr:hypothetical protein [Gallionella sp.]
MPTEIGGYFGLELPWHGELYPDALKLQSGRAAIRAALESAAITQVLLPAYVCDSVIKAVTDSGAKAVFYCLDESRYPKDLPATFPKHSALLYVNYFGLCAKNIAKLRTVIPACRLIIDNSQALFATHQGELATIYSPRKFVGVPDGGLLIHSASLKFKMPDVEDSASIERMRPLIVRMAYSARQGYSDFKKIPLSLQDTTPLLMSRLTQRLLKSIPWTEIAQRRRKNFLLMSKELDGINGMHWELDAADVPMCYPLTLPGEKVDQIRDQLTARNIFIPIYWQDALPRITPNSIETILTNHTLFIPIDQRMESNQVKMLSDLLLKMAS